MAIQVYSHKPLDPNASPYHKIHSPNLCVYQVLPPPPTYYHLFPPVITHSRFYSYSVHVQPAPMKPLPLSLPPPALPEKKKESLSLGPVPSGPRNPKSRVPRHRRKVNKAVCSEKCGAGVRNGGGTGNGNQPTRQRWKNRSGEYERVLPLDSETTTVMIKNIPNKYTRKLIIQTLDNHCRAENKKNNNVDANNIVSAYDFLYLPIDFNRRGNAGFAFVNFTTPEAASRFKEAFQGKHWDFFESPKIAEITRARIQGKRYLINNCRMMDFTSGSEEDMPVSFYPARDGSGFDRSKMTIVGKFLR